MMGEGLQKVAARHMKLRPKQREALEWLSKQPWTSPWWAGKPHGRWPKEMGPQTYNSLSLAGLVRSTPGTWSEKTIEITDAGRIALAACTET